MSIEMQKGTSPNPPQEDNQSLKGDAFVCITENGHADKITIIIRCSS